MRLFNDYQVSIETIGFINNIMIIMKWWLMKMASWVDEDDEKVDEDGDYKDDDAHTKKENY